MTMEEFSKLPFRWQSHLALASEYCTVYVCTTIPLLGVCVHKPRDPNTGACCGRTYKHYQYQGHIFKSLQKLLEVL